MLGNAALAEPRRGRYDDSIVDSVSFVGGTTGRAELASIAAAETGSSAFWRISRMMLAEVSEWRRSRTECVAGANSLVSAAALPSQARMRALGGINRRTLEMIDKYEAERLQRAGVPR